MSITSEPYSVSTLTEARKIALDLKENLENVLKYYVNNPVKRGELLYGILMQAENAKRFIFDRVVSKPRRTEANYLFKIQEGLDYLKDNFDDRLFNK